MHDENNLLLATIFSIGSILIGIIFTIMKIFNQLKTDGAERQKVVDRIGANEKQISELKRIIEKRDDENRSFRRDMYKGIDELKAGQNEIMLTVTERLTKLEVGGCNPSKGEKRRFQND